MTQASFNRRVTQWIPAIDWIRTYQRADLRGDLIAVITALLIGIALVFLTPLFYFIPNAILASVIMVAVFGLVDVHEVKHLWKVKRDDLGLLVFTFVATRVLGGARPAL